MNEKIETFADVLRIHGVDIPDRVAMRADDRTWTYRELYEESARVAQALLADGVEPGQRVAVLDQNAPEYFPFFFGSVMAGGVTLAVNWRLAPPEMEYILNDAQVRVLLVGPDFVDHLAQMKLETVERVVVRGAPPTGEHIGYGDWIAAREPIDPQLPCTPDETCYQLYTSGTTGRPKGVELTHANLLSSMRAGAEAWGVDQDTVNLVAMPFFHIAGSGWGIAGMCYGAESVLLGKLDPMLVLELIEKHRVTSALFVPAVLQILNAIPALEKMDMSSLRTIVYGASPISEEVLSRSMQLFGCDFVQAYGLTETSGAITVMLPEDHDPGGPRAHLLRSAGRPGGDVELRIVDPETLEDLDEGAVGEILCRTRQNMKGYWLNPEATAEAFPEGRDQTGLGWFRTGDAGSLRDGYLYIEDRVKDMIVSGGENVYPAEVENALMSHPAVADVAVIGVPSERWGETVKALIVPEPAQEVSDADLIAHCRERLAPYKCPTSVERRESLPRNPSGKVLKKELREPYWEGRERSVN